MPTSVTGTPETEADGGPQGPVYAYKPSLMAAPLEFRLLPDGLGWQKGRFSGRTPYDRIRRIRMSFRPMTMQNYRFVTEVWPENGPVLPIASTSVKGMVEQERFDPAYRAFVGELHRRILAAGGKPLLQTGSQPFLYWPGVAVFVGCSLTLAALTVRALSVEQWGGAAFVAGFLALFLWQAGQFFRRNKPGTYTLDAVPETVLPKA
jgi:hypothetical protein